MRPAHTRPTLSSLPTLLMTMRTSRKVVVVLVLVAMTLLLHAAISDDISSPASKVLQSNEDDATTTNATTNTTTMTNRPTPSRPVASNDDLFLTYLPHGDYFAQRQSLENAIVLAWLIGRTLVVPPAIVDKDVPREPPKTLSRRLLALTSEEAPGRRELCAKDASYVWCTVDEFKKKGKNGEERPSNTTLIRWSELLDFDFARQNVHILEYETFDLDELYEFLEIDGSSRDVHDLDLYNVRIYESASTQGQESQRKYDEQMTISSLQQEGARFTLFGSMDAVDRLVLSSSDALQFQEQVSQSFAEIKQPAMRYAANEIVRQLGEQERYIGVYLRGLDVTATRRKGKHSAEYDPNILRFKENVDSALADRVIEALGVHQKESVQLLENPADVSSTTQPLSMTACTVPTSHINIFVVPWLLPRDDRRWNARGAMTALLRNYPCTFSLPDFYYLLVPYDEVTDKGGFTRDGTNTDRILPEFLKRMIETSVLARSRHLLFGVYSRVVDATGENIVLETVTLDAINVVSSVRSTLGLPVDALHVKNLTPKLPRFKKQRTKSKKGQKQR